MPLTPKFSLSQTPTHVNVEISVPSFRLTAGTDGGMEVALLGDRSSEFHFYAHPYLLKLNFFPHGFVDPDEEQLANGSGGSGSATPTETAKYDPSTQTVVVPLRKQRPADLDDDDESNFWPDLELTARMIQPREIPTKWLHEVVDHGENDAKENESNEEETPAQASPEPSPPAHPLVLPTQQTPGDGYGFGQIFRNILTDYCRSGLAGEMLQLKTCDPENSTMDERRDERLEDEFERFDLERYLADGDLDETSGDVDYLYPMVLAYEPWWRTMKSNERAASPESLAQDLTHLAIHENDAPEPNPTNSSSMFTDDEKLLLSTIPYPLLPQRLLEDPNPNLWCGLLELLLAGVYDHLATLGDPTVESAWTVSVLAPQLSWLDASSHGSVKKTVHTFLRRLLVCPCWRNTRGLGFKVLEETHRLLTSGRPAVTRLLLQMRKILDASEVYYLGNKLCVDPSLYWIQNLSAKDARAGLGMLASEVAECLENFRGLLRDAEDSLGVSDRLRDYFEEAMEDVEAADEASSSEGSDSDDSESDDDDDSSSSSASSSEEGIGEEPAASAGIEGLENDDDETEASATTALPRRPLLDDAIGRNTNTFLAWRIGSPGDDEGGGGGASGESSRPNRPPLIQEL